MEQLLRSEEVPAVTGDQGVEIPSELLYNVEHSVLYFPVRHHSPACSFHLEKAAEDYKPDLILIEGPENAGNLISVLLHEDTKPPLALYYAYRDRAGLVTEKKGDYKCYYPFLDCSPELTALRQAKDNGIPARFIDLSYGEILIGTASGKGIRREGNKQTYNDDYLLSRSRYLALLCEKTGLRDFEELWEKYFEIQGLTEATADFMRQMLTYCILSRKNTPEEELEEDGTILRERYMAKQIAEASKTYKKILVVTGGFHSYGLWELLSKEQDGTYAFTGKPVKLHKEADGQQEVYPMAYSMEAADALNGYASGMQSPGFYQRVWKNLKERESAAGAYEDAVLHFLASSGRQARRKEESVSSYDEICAFSMARGLAALRGKREPGLYELKDSARSSFVKGELNLSTDGALRVLKELVTGTQVGRLCKDAARPPLLSDFEEHCRSFGLKLHSTLEQTVTLEIFKKEKHLRMSRFFYQAEFLDCSFAKRKKGADLVKRQDQNRIREIWTYKWSEQVTAALIDASISGGTCEEAARSLLKSRFGESTGCREAAELLVKGFLMGLSEEQAEMSVHLAEVLAADGDFFSLTKGFSHMLMLLELQDLYQVRDALHLDQVTEQCFQKIIQLLPSMGQVGEERQQECMESLRLLYQAAGRNNANERKPVLMEALKGLLGRGSVNPGVEGTVLGLLYGYEGGFGRQITETARGYIQGSGEMLSKSAAFLRGLFFTARDFVFVSGEFLNLIDELLGRLSGEEFLRLLPELRMAFGYFTPLETDRIAGRAAALHGRKKRDLLTERRVSPEEFAYGEALDAYAGERILSVGKLK
ncbi:DUF5682 family protein [Candidatus Merdisoma sp. JLR.KK006]|uniref:DUF5682 family protein n=1 Tax=Candidatus Merdisoma sp. JLR.KK006 TaxID=3112626 RepID=UPI002FEFE91F